MLIFWHELTTLRSVSLTSQIAMFLEHLTLNSLQLLRSNKTISCHQHVFQSGYSGILQLLSCLNDWTECYDSSIQTDGIWTSLKWLIQFPTNGFCINWNKMKLRVWYGIGSNYFSQTEGRELYSRMESHHELMSSARTILGPIIFPIFVNDISGIVTSTVKLFADDTKL